MVPSNTLSERITQYYSEFTESNRRLADYLQLNPDKILILSTHEIGEACRVSKTSVSRFIRKLGYEDHLELRNELLRERDKGTPVITAPADQDELQQEIRSLEQLWSQFGDENTSEVIERLSKAKRIKIIGYRNSYPLALHLRQQLMQCRDNVDLLPLPGQTIGEDLASISDDDFIVVIGIRRRPTFFAALVEQLSQYDTLLITDQSGQQYVSGVNHYFICHMNNHAPLDSYAVPMSLLSHLANKTYLQLGAAAVKNSRKVTANYSLLNETE